MTLVRHAAYPGPPETATENGDDNDELQTLVRQGNEEFVRVTSEMVSAAKEDMAQFRGKVFELDETKEEKVLYKVVGYGWSESSGGDFVELQFEDCPFSDKYTTKEFVELLENSSAIKNVQ